MANVMLFSISKADVVSGNLDINAALAAVLNSDDYCLRITEPEKEDVEIFKAAELFKVVPKDIKIGKLTLSHKYGWIYNMYRDKRPYHSGSWHPEVLKEMGPDDVLYISAVK